MRWTKPALIEDALKYNNRGEWQTISKAAYESARRQGILDECCAHMPPRLVWDIESIKEIALRFTARTKWRKAHSGAYQAAIRLGVLDECCAHMPLPKSKQKKKTTETRVLIDTNQFFSSI